MFEKRRHIMSHVEWTKKDVTDAVMEGIVPDV
jgi:hypothetical protein